MKPHQGRKLSVLVAVILVTTATIAVTATYLGVKQAGVEMVTVDRESATPLAASPSAPALTAPLPASAAEVTAPAPEPAATTRDEANALRQQVNALAKIVEEQRATIASLQNLDPAAGTRMAARTAGVPAATKAASDIQDDADDEPLGRRDPTTIYTRAEIDTAIAEVETLVDTAFAQGGFTALDETRYRQLNRYLPTEIAAAFNERLMTALNNGEIVKYD